MRGTYDQRYQVKQFVAEVEGAFSRFQVFKTGDDKWYLFSQLDPSGCSTGLQVPVKKTDLQDDVRSALAHGWGHTRRVR